METGQTNALELISDSAFTSALSTEHILCVDISEHQIHLGVFNGANHGLVACGKSMLSHRTDWFGASSLLRNDFQNVHVVFHPERSYLSHAENADDSALIQVPLDSIKGWYCYPHTGFYTEISAKLPKAIVKPFGKLFLEGASQANRYQKGLKLYVHLSDLTLYLMCFSDSALIFYTTEHLKETTEAIYYVSKAMEISRFDQLESKIYLSGDVEEQGALMAFLKERVKYTYMNKGFRFQKSSVALSSVPKHEYFSVINSFQCA